MRQERVQHEVYGYTGTVMAWLKGQAIVRWDEETDYRQWYETVDLRQLKPFTDPPLVIGNGERFEFAPFVSDP